MTLLCLLWQGALERSDLPSTQGLVCYSGSSFYDLLIVASVPCGAVLQANEDEDCPLGREDISL